MAVLLAYAAARIVGVVRSYVGTVGKQAYLASRSWSLSAGERSQTSGKPNALPGCNAAKR